MSPPLCCIFAKVICWALDSFHRIEFTYKTGCSNRLFVWSGVAGALASYSSVVTLICYCLLRTVAYAVRAAVVPAVAQRPFSLWF